jgi:hypothetical protein
MVSSIRNEAKLGTLLSLFEIWHLTFRPLSDSLTFVINHLSKKIMLCNSFFHLLVYHTSMIKFQPG